MNSILVTGGAGFIGSHTCLNLLKKNFNIYILDSFVNSSPISLERISVLLNKEGINIDSNIHIFKGDVRNESDLRLIFQDALKKKKPIESVVHFAGLKAVGESNDMALKYWDFNVSGTIALLKIMEKYDCFKIVFSSSATIYRTNKEKFIKENDELGPINPYGVTKLVVEKMLNDVFNSNPNKWKIVNLRYFNPIGAHPSGLIGEDPLGIPNNLFPLLMKVAMGEIKEIKVFGNDWPTKDGTGVRDYIHVMDLAEGHLLALEYLSKAKPQILNLNLGTGKGTSVLELLKTFENVNNVKIPYVYTNRRKGDSAIVVANNALAKSLLNWNPAFKIEDMCRDGYIWQLRNPNGY
ncbi:MAG: UDP-glucose 4-epimerase GalE [Flavobacteriales bacterium TMED235]|nr:MAG: UDP-glucose 4-epimerase GalE [Flavobacteriales bacterium TMED235]|tara:strand:- start:509 stop:1561 length:1053 start_codon:yes stop_codon:yes gene_type:complete